MAAAAEEAELVLHKEPGPRVRGGGGRSGRWGPRSLRSDSLAFVSLGSYSARGKQVCSTSPVNLKMSCPRLFSVIGSLGGGAKGYLLRDFYRQLLLGSICGLATLVEKFS